jgi:hypothetical protein
MRTRQRETKVNKFYLNKFSRSRAQHMQTQVDLSITN